MIPQDKFGREIKDYVFKVLLRNELKLKSNGYVESKKKPNLFFKKTEEGVYFADMRGTKEVPIWVDTWPLFYWKFENAIPPWKRRRLIKEELLSLFEIGCPCRLSFEYHDSEEFENVSTFVDKEHGIYKWADGICKVCGQDFKAEGTFCSKECEVAYDELFKTKCAKCGKSIDWNNSIKHHISYEPERKVIICRSCHMKIHKSKAPSALKPSKETTKKFYKEV